MRNATCCFLLLLSSYCFAQQDKPTDKKSKEDHSIGIGIKFGLNFANVTNASSINSKSQTGFNAGIFISPSSKSILSSRTELTFSRQGYDYSTDSSSGSVKLDYITLSNSWRSILPSMFRYNLADKRPICLMQRQTVRKNPLAMRKPIRSLVFITGLITDWAQALKCIRFWA